MEYIIMFVNELKLLNRIKANIFKKVPIENVKSATRITERHACHPNYVINLEGFGVSVVFHPDIVFFLFCTV